MFSNLTAFYKYTKAEKLKVICLSATSFDGIEHGSESKAINMLGYKRFSLSAEPINMNPPIHERISLGSYHKYAALIDEKKKVQPVLIYASPGMFTYLVEYAGLKVVT